MALAIGGPAAELVRGGARTGQSAHDHEHARPAAHPQRRARAGGGPAARGGGRHLLGVRARVHPAQDRRGRAAHRAVGRAGRQRLPGREHPRGVRRRRAWHGRAVHGRRGDLRGGLLAAADRGLPRHRRQHPGPPRQRGAEGAMAARHRPGHHQDRLRHHRARRGHQLAQPVHVAQAGRQGLSPERPEDLHLRRRARRPRAGGRAHAGRGRQARPARAGDRGRGRARLHAHADPDAQRGPGRASGSCSSTTSRSPRTAWSAGRRAASERSSTG